MTTTRGSEWNRSANRLSSDFSFWSLRVCSSSTVFLLSGTFGRSDISYRAYFKNAGGLSPGRKYATRGALPVGRVTKVQCSDPQNSTRMEIDFAVEPSVPVKTDSNATITSVSPLGDNFLGIVPGTLAAPKHPKGRALKSCEYYKLRRRRRDDRPDWDRMQMTLLNNLNDRVVALKDTMDRVNDLLNDAEPREYFGEPFAILHGMLE